MVGPVPETGADHCRRAIGCARHWVPQPGVNEHRLPLKGAEDIHQHLQAGSGCHVCEGGGLHVGKGGHGRAERQHQLKRRRPVARPPRQQQPNAVEGGAGHLRSLKLRGGMVRRGRNAWRVLHDNELGASRQWPPFAIWANARDHAWSAQPANRAARWSGTHVGALNE